MTLRGILFEAGFPDDYPWSWFGILKWIEDSYECKLISSKNQQGTSLLLLTGSGRNFYAPANSRGYRKLCFDCEFGKVFNVRQ